MSIAGKCIVNTRPLHQQHEINRSLILKKAEVISFPSLEIVPLLPSAEALQELRVQAGDWVVFTSRNGVEATFRDWLPAMCGDSAAEVLPRLHFAVVGNETARALRALAFEPEIIPKLAHARALGEALIIAIEHAVGSPAVWIFQSTDAGGDVIAAFANSKTLVHEIAVYTTKIPEPKSDETAKLRALAQEHWGGIDAVIFTSSQTVKNFLTLLQSGEPRLGSKWWKRLRTIPVAVIGEPTQHTAIESGFENVLVAAQATSDGIIAVLDDYFRSKEK